MNHQARIQAAVTGIVALYFSGPFGCFGGGMYDASGAFGSGPSKLAPSSIHFFRSAMCSGVIGSPSSGIRSLGSVETIRRKASLPSTSVAWKPGLVESPAAITFS